MPMKWVEPELCCTLDSGNKIYHVYRESSNDMRTYFYQTAAFDDAQDEFDIRTLIGYHDYDFNTSIQAGYSTMVAYVKQVCKVNEWRLFPRQLTLVKTTIVIWSRVADNASGRELVDLAREATTGSMYCSKQDSDTIEVPQTDPDWDGTEFFFEEDDEDESCCAGCDTCGTHCVPGCSSGNGVECTAKDASEEKD